MNPDKFFTDLAALTGCEYVSVQWMKSANGRATFEVALVKYDESKAFGSVGGAGTGPTVEAAMQEARAKLAEHYA